MFGHGVMNETHHDAFVAGRILCNLFRFVLADAWPVARAGTDHEDTLSPRASRNDPLKFLGGCREGWYCQTAYRVAYNAKKTGKLHACISWSGSATPRRGLAVGIESLSSARTRSWWCLDDVRS